MTQTAHALGAALVAVFLLAAPASAEEQKMSPVYKAQAVLKDASGKEVGTATFSTTPSGALLDLNLTAIPPGVHAVHVHAVGKCEPPDFKSAGPHFNPDQTKHGIMSPEGPHAGDLPNIHVPADGKLEVEFLDPVVTLSQESALLDADGSSIVIHAGPDDTRPTLPAIPATASSAASSPRRPSGSENRPTRRTWRHLPLLR